MPTIRDELYRVAHEARQEGEFEWARIIHLAADYIKDLEKDLENCRIINEMLSEKRAQE